MKNAISFILVVFLSLPCFGQSDTEKYSTVGINISPLAVHLLGGEEGYRKSSVQVRHCFGWAIVRASVNKTSGAYGSEAYSYPSWEIMNDSMATYMSLSSALPIRKDFRIGVEKDWGWEKARFSLGADFIIGKRIASVSVYSYQQQYDTIIWGFPQASGPGINDNSQTQEVQHLKIGFDLSAGFEWRINRYFNLTTQWTPEWNLYKLMKRKEPVEGYLFTPSASHSWMNAELNLDVVLSFKF